MLGGVCVWLDCVACLTGLGRWYVLGGLIGLPLEAGGVRFAVKVYGLGESGVGSSRNF